MSKGGRIPTTGGEGQGGGFMADNNAYREPYSNPYRQGGFRVPMGQSGGYSQAGQRSGSFGSKGGQQRPSYNEYPRFPSRGNAKGGIGGMAPPPSSRYNPQRPNYTAQPYRPSTPNFRKIGQDAFANTSNGGFGSPYDEIMPAPAPVQQPQPQPQPPMNPSKGGNYGPMPVQQLANTDYREVPLSTTDYKIGDDAPMATTGLPINQVNAEVTMADVLQPTVSQPTFSPSMMPSKGGYNTMPTPPAQTGAVAQPMGPIQFTARSTPSPDYAVPDPALMQAQTAMMPSKGGMPVAQFNPQPVPLNQSPNITPARQNSSPFGPRNMRYGR